MRRLNRAEDGRTRQLEAVQGNTGQKMAGEGN